jgi:hypothetical protein
MGVGWDAPVPGPLFDPGPEALTDTLPDADPDTLPVEGVPPMISTVGLSSPWHAPTSNADHTSPVAATIPARPNHLLTIMSPFTSPSLLPIH